MKANENRPDWDNYFLQLAYVVKTRSNCLRRAVGVVIVKDKRIISTGYNGTPMGIKNCFEGGCIRCSQRESNILKADERKDLCICIHAEQNSLLQSAYHGISTKDTIIYTTVAPCLQCAQHIINGGIKKVIYTEDLDNTLGLDLLKQAGVLVKQISLV